MINNRVLQDPVQLGSRVDVEGSTRSVDFQDSQPYLKSLRKSFFRGPQTERERKLLYICALLMALALSFLIALSVVVARNRLSQAAPSHGDDSKQCQSSSCMQAAQALLDSMDTSADPCHDFYRYACGGWIAKHPIPDEKSRYSTFDALSDEVSQKLAKRLKEATNQNHTKSVINAAILFQGCIDEDARETKGIGPLKDALNEFGDWPMGNSEWKDVDYKWHKRIASTTRVLGISPIIALSVQADANKTSQYIIYLDQGSFGLGRNQLVNLTSSKRNMEIIAAYKNYIVSTGKLMNPSANETQLENDAEDMIQFESALARLSKPREERRDAESWYHKMKVAKMQKDTENQYFKWTDFLDDVFSGLGKITEDTDVILSASDYIKNSIKLANRTTPRTLANYIGWTVLTTLGPHSTKQFRDNSFHFHKVSIGVQKPKKLERTCMDSVSGLLGFAVGRLYVDEYFTEDDKQDVERLIEAVRNAYKLTLDANGWMDEDTKNKALEKLKSMINMMGYPPWIKNDDELNDYYKTVAGLKKDEFFTSLLNTRKSRVEFILAKWNQPTNRTNEWLMEPSVVNAFYNPSANTITFPAGILNLPFYKYGRSLALNFGGIGSVIGHEISHGFDDQGRQFDMEGNLVDWWSIATKDKFNERAQCFRDQYSSYVEPTVNLNLNGNNSVGENIADNGGLRNAFIAYKMQVLLTEDNDIIKNKMLPGISATPEQLFFIGYASIWCGSERKESLEMTIQYDPHSPTEFRVMVPLTNSKAFAEAFNCPVGSRMNPESKCVLW